MQRVEIKNNCEQLIESMSLALVKSKVKSVDKLIAKIKGDEIKTVTLAALERKIKKIHEVEFQAFMAAWSLVTPETWAFYEMMAYKDLREQTILAECIINFKDAWRKATDVKCNKKSKKK